MRIPLFLLLLLCTSVGCLKFLVHSTRFAKSHVNFLARLADALVDAGHEVVMHTANIQRPPRETGLKSTDSVHSLPRNAGSWEATWTECMISFFSRVPREFVYFEIMAGRALAHSEPSHRRTDDEEGASYRGVKSFFCEYNWSPGSQQSSHWYCSGLREAWTRADLSLIYFFHNQVPQCAEAAAYEDKFDTEISQNVWTMRHPIQMFAVRLPSRNVYIIIASGATRSVSDARQDENCILWIFRNFSYRNNAERVRSLVADRPFPMKEVMRCWRKKM